MTAAEDRSGEAGPTGRAPTDPARTNAGATSELRQRAALLALVLGAVALGASPVFVRLAEVGPFASAFWRAALAVPALVVWAWIERRSTAWEARGATARTWAAVALAGVFFAGDLAFWHLAILNTSVANATLLATLAPVWVVLLSGLVLGEPVSVRTLAGLAVCLLGAGLLVGATWTFAPERLRGDLFGVATSLFFGLYFLAVRFARRALPAGVLHLASTGVTALVLLPIALVADPALLPASGSGLTALVALALVSQAGGQGLLAVALGHLPAAFSALVIFLEAIAAALLALLVLGEPIEATQVAGALLIFLGIGVARPRGSV